MPNFNEQDKGYKDGLKLTHEGKKKHYFNFKPVGRIPGRDKATP